MALMTATSFDPYHALWRATWRQRIDGWRAQPGEAAFHLAGLLALVSFMVAAALGGWSSLVRVAAGLLGVYPLESAVLLGAGVAWTARYRIGGQLREWEADWLSAQPIPRALRRRRLLQHALVMLLGWCLPLGTLLCAAEADVSVLLILLAVVAGCITAGTMVALRRSTRRSHAAHRETPFAAGTGDTLAAWQWAAAGASLAPTRVTPLLVVLLLMPRGPWTMILPALLLILLLSLARAWQLSVDVIPRAELWLETQPLRAGSWLRQLIKVPLLLGLALALLLAVSAGLITSTAMSGWVAVASLAALSLLWAVTLRWRRRPRSIGLNGTIQLVLLAAMFQALPPALPIVWCMQMVWLLQRGWR